MDKKRGRKAQAPHNHHPYYPILKGRWDGQRPTIVCLCGSTRFKEQYRQEEARLTLEGKIVLTCGVFGYADGIELTEAQKEALDALHLRKIDLAREVRVINVGGYIGQSTKREIEYATRVGKRVSYLGPTSTTVIVCSVYADDALLIPIAGPSGDEYARSVGWGQGPEGEWECPECHARESHYREQQ